MSLGQGGDSPPVGSPVTAADVPEPVGELTSVAQSPTTGEWLALARVKTPYFEGKERLGVLGKPVAFVAQGAPEIG